MRTLVIPLLVILLVGTSPSGASEKFDFKGIVLGSDIAAIEGAARFSCRDPQSPLGDQLCSLNVGERETIAGAPVRTLFLYYYARSLETIFVGLDEKHFAQVVAALVEKYGEGNLKAEPVQNRMGASFENRIVSWRRGGAVLEAKRYYGGKLDASGVTYRTDFALEESARRRAKTVKERAKDL